MHLFVLHMLAGLAVQIDCPALPVAIRLDLQPTSAQLCFVRLRASHATTFA